METAVLEWGAERARAGPWRGDGQVAYLSPLPEAGTPSAAFLRHCLRELSRDGYRRVITSALASHERAAFDQVGFRQLERLVLLSHSLRGIDPQARRPSASRLQLRRGGIADHPGVITLDSVAFPPFWQIDSAGLQEAISATPAARFRVATSASGASPASLSPASANLTAAASALLPGLVAGYSVAGRSRRRGYLQRLAVDPRLRRQGVGRALVLDALRWFRRWGVARATVNTQETNLAAIALYRAMGFEVDGPGLWVLGIELG